MKASNREIVENKIGDGRVICDVCNATLATYGVCVAPFGAWCPGFDAIEVALGYPFGRQPVWRPSEKGSEQ